MPRIGFDVKDSSQPQALLNHPASLGAARYCQWWECKLFTKGLWNTNPKIVSNPSSKQPKYKYDLSEWFQSDSLDCRNTFEIRAFSGMDFSQHTLRSFGSFIISPTYFYLEANVFHKGGIWVILPLPSGKHTKFYGKSACLLGKSTINVPFSIAMLNYQSVYPINSPLNHYKISLNHDKSQRVTLANFPFRVEARRVARFEDDIESHDIPVLEYLRRRRWLGTAHFDLKMVGKKLKTAEDQNISCGNLVILHTPFLRHT